MHPAPTSPGNRGNREAAIRALVFDFDGLILDTETADHQAWSEIYLAHGAQLPLERWVHAIGTHAGVFDPCDHLERQLGELVDRVRLKSKHSARTTEILANRWALPGVVEFIERARDLDIKLAVASSSSRGWVSGHLDRLGLYRHFDVMLCSDDVERVKPEPDLYLAVLRALSVSARESIAIEDSPNGITAAKSAGLYCVSVPNALTRNLCMDAADLVLVSLASTTLDEVIEHAKRPRRRAS